MNHTDSTTRQYGASIALVSGLYSLVTAAGGAGMMATNSGLLMALLGVVVVVHGVVLLTPASERLGAASGPLMIVYALLMLLNQALVGTTDWGMDTGMGMGGATGMTGTMPTGMGVDLGMVALAVLMLVSGLIMTSQPAPRSRM